MKKTCRTLCLSLLLSTCLCSNLVIKAQNIAQPEQGQIPPHPPRLPEAVIPAFPGEWGGGMFRASELGCI